MTAQVPEQIIYEGIQLSLLRDSRIPAEHPRICVVSNEEAAKNNKYFGSAACHRGYIGEWAVRKGVLYLVGLKGIYRLLPGPDLPATWFTGTLRMPTSGMIEFVNSDYDTRYCSEFFAEVERGVVVRTWNELNTPYQVFHEDLAAYFDLRPGTDWITIQSRSLRGYGTTRIAKLLPNLEIQLTIGATDRGIQLDLNRRIRQMAQADGFEVLDRKSTSGSRKGSRIYPAIAVGLNLARAIGLLIHVQTIAEVLHQKEAS